MKFHLTLQSLALLAGFGAAAPSTSPVDLAGAVKRASTCNTPSNRACWTDGFDINTDYEANIPTTGVTRTYNFEVTEIPNWVGGDGEVKAVAMLVNGQFPGPTITADWGDTIQVTVKNSLVTNGTSFHWHGIRQLNNCINDGANGVTECPIPPGHSRTYTFLAQQYGTSWYHSHFSDQYANGVVGPIVINGPASLNYDIDLGPLMISDWYYGAAEEIQLSLIPQGTAPPPSDNVLFNGQHVSATGGGNYTRITLTPGRRHLLRLINPSVENTFTVSLVGHDFTVIATDFVPVDAYTTSQIYIGIGQRYDVTIDASQAVDNYWLNVTFSGTGACGSTNSLSPAAIFTYDGAPGGTPTNPGTAPPDSLCEDFTSYVPVVQRDAPQGEFPTSPANDLNLTLVTQPWEGQTRVYWNINGQDMNITWGAPTLQYVEDGTTANIPARYNVFAVSEDTDWSFWVINNGLGVPHPIHLHGHDFLILGHSTPSSSPFTISPVPFDPATDLASLNFSNPTRRDVTMLPGSGWLALAFKNDNPGAWLMHCHIAWHVSQGLSVEFLERVQDIPNVMDLTALDDNCKAWNDFYPTDPTPQIDSGLRIRN